VGETGRPREQHFSGLHRHRNDEAWDEQPGMVCGLVEVYTYGPRRRAAGGGECGGFSRIRGEQLFYGKQSGRGRRLYVLVRKESGVAGVTEWWPWPPTVLGMGSWRWRSISKLQPRALDSELL